jgi:hypothetical protein
VVPTANGEHDATGLDDAVLAAGRTTIVGDIAATR